MKKGKIIFKNVHISGEKQVIFFAILDLLDGFFTEDEKKNMEISYEGSHIDNFIFNFTVIPKGSSKYNFAEYVLKKQEENKIKPIKNRSRKLIN